MDLVKDIIADCLTTLQSVSRGKWDQTELLGYLNEGQAEIASLTGAFRKEIAMPAAPKGIYRLPDNCVEIRWVRYNGKFIEPISYRKLYRQEGNEFQIKTASEPIYWYNDMTSPFDLRLFPIPSAVSRLLIAWSGDSEPSPATTTGGARYIDNDADTVTYVDQDGSTFAADTDRVGIVRFIDDSSTTHEMIAMDEPSESRGSRDPNYPILGEAENSRQYGSPMIGFVEGVRVGYSYIPQSYTELDARLILPDNHHLALKWWILSRAYMKSIADEDQQRSMIYENKFLKRVAQTIHQESRSFTTRPRTGKFTRV